MKSNTLAKFAFAGALLASSACVSAPLRFATEPLRPNESVLGPVEASSTGLMLFQFIPINQNYRFERAYEKALAKAPGAARLIDVTIEERWFWAWVLNGYIFKVSGTAVSAK